MENVCLQLIHALYINIQREMIDTLSSEQDFHVKEADLKDGNLEELLYYAQLNDENDIL